MVSPHRGEVWLVDLGLAAKMRPCVILSVPADGQDDRVLVTVVSHTTRPRERMSRRVKLVTVGMRGWLLDEISLCYPGGASPSEGNA
jgi:mRNA-degrading endonuclease toxin of MazEF toxin-antitoxin module